MRFLTTLAIGLTIVVLVIVGSNLETIADFLSRFLDGILTFLTALGWFVLVLGSAASVVYLVQFYRSRESSRLRQKDGSFPLRAYTIDGGGEVLLNPNNMIGAASVFHPQHGFFELPSTMPPELQADVRKIIERTHQLQALTPGDDAITSKFGSMWRGGNSGVANAATGRLLAGNYDRPVKALSGAVETATPDPLATPPAPRLALTDALAQSTGSRWIVGQSDNGALATFEPTAHAHAAIVGSTGTGKTRSVGYALALAAIRSGWHVLILDPDGGADWSPFRTHAEWQETDRASFPGQIEAIHRFYERRASLDNPRPVLVVIEEYGDMIRQLRTANRNAADQVDNWLDSILRRGRKRRMHVALIDQYPEHWSQPVIGGTKFRAVFQLGPGQGAKVEEYHAAKLPDVGRFLVRGIEYNSFDASTQAAAVLRQLPAPTSTRRVINGT
ncbi:MAG TPA: type IV secretory system conjugative DNA transfer family protein, partial [Caldilineaceae bacterium]|nr:type IV secretory system conjugative DNA transfer family protein [Caldilineaceae bacterium]